MAEKQTSEWFNALYYMWPYTKKGRPSDAYVLSGLTFPSFVQELASRFPSGNLDANSKQQLLCTDEKNHKKLGIISVIDDSCLEGCACFQSGLEALNFLNQPQRVLNQHGNRVMR